MFCFGAELKMDTKMEFIVRDYFVTGTSYFFRFKYSSLNKAEKNNILKEVCVFVNTFYRNRVRAY